MSLLTGGRGDDGKPDDTLCRRLPLLLLHIAGAVVLADIGTVVIGPFQHHGLAPVIGEPVNLALGVYALEVGRRLAYAQRGARAAGVQSEGDEGDTK